MNPQSLNLFPAAILFLTSTLSGIDVHVTSPYRWSGATRKMTRNMETDFVQNILKHQ